MADGTVFVLLHHKKDIVRCTLPRDADWGGLLQAVGKRLTLGHGVSVRALRGRDGSLVRAGVDVMDGETLTVGKLAYRTRLGPALLPGSPALQSDQASRSMNVVLPPSGGVPGACDTRYTRGRREEYLGATFQA